MMDQVCPVSRFDPGDCYKVRGFSSPPEMRRFNPALTLFATLILWGCESGTSMGPEPVTFEPAQASGAGFAALYAPPPYDVVPYPNDIYNPVAAGAGRTLAVPVRITSPLATAVNTLDGFSTVAAITAPFNAPIDPKTLVPFDPLAPSGTETVFVLDASRGVPLIPGVHYSVGLSNATGTNDSVLEITPLQPLTPKTTYVFVLTSGIQSIHGVAAGADQAFGAVRNAHLAGLDSVPGAPELDPLFPAIAPLIDTAVGLLGVPGPSIAVAWSATTQSITDVLEAVQASAVAMPHQVAPMGITTAHLGLGLPGAASLHAGWMQIPYYGDPNDVLASFWVNSDFVPPSAANPHPLPRGGLLRIPVFAATPSLGEAPPRGWPVVLFQHGVTSNRTSLIAIADAFASLGFATVAIDLPLHGVTDTGSIFYQGAGSPFGDNERHFNLDNVGALGSLVPDGEVDNGWQIFNVANPLNARDHARQAVSDLFHLIRTVPAMDVSGDGVPDLNGDRIHFVGVSLGAIFSTPFLALNREFSTATLSSAGGPYSHFLTDPMAITFGRPIRAAVEAAGLPFGSDGFQDFVRDLQTVLDSVDPMNFAALAASLHPIHMVGVRADTSVPMSLIDNVAGIMKLSDISATTVDPTGVRGIVRFNRGGHAAILNPADLAVTVEMQTQAVAFAASGGTVIPIGNSEIVE